MEVVERQGSRFFSLKNSCVNNRVCVRIVLKLGSVYLRFVSSKVVSLCKQVPSNNIKKNFGDSGKQFQ